MPSNCVGFSTIYMDKQSHYWLELVHNLTLNGLYRHNSCSSENRTWCYSNTKAQFDSQRMQKLMKMDTFVFCLFKRLWICCSMSVSWSVHMIFFFHQCRWYKRDVSVPVQRVSRGKALLCHGGWRLNWILSLHICAVLTAPVHLHHEDASFISLILRILPSICTAHGSLSLLPLVLCHQHLKEFSMRTC